MTGLTAHISTFAIGSATPRSVVQPELVYHGERFASDYINVLIFHELEINFPHHRLLQKNLPSLAVTPEAKRQLGAERARGMAAPRPNFPDG